MPLSTTIHSSLRLLDAAPYLQTRDRGKVVCCAACALSAATAALVLCQSSDDDARVVAVPPESLRSLQRFSTLDKLQRLTMYVVLFGVVLS